MRNWKPRRLGGGLGSTRAGGKKDAVKKAAAAKAAALPEARRRRPEQQEARQRKSPRRVVYRGRPTTGQQRSRRTHHHHRFRRPEWREQPADGVHWAHYPRECVRSQTPREQVPVTQADIFYQPPQGAGGRTGGHSKSRQLRKRKSKKSRRKFHSRLLIGERNQKAGVNFILGF